VPDSKLADQLRLVEAIAFSFDREVRQPVQGQSRFRALPSLTLDRLGRPPGSSLRRGHAGRRQRLHRHREAYGSAISYGSDRCARSIMTEYPPNWGQA